jgi:hypothetical protein
MLPLILKSRYRIFISAATAAALLVVVIPVTLERLHIDYMKSTTPPYTLSKAKSGLFISDSLRNGNLTRDQLFEKFNKQYNRVWTLYGSAIARKASVDVSENTVEGMSLGIKSQVKGEWAGYFAMSRDDYGSLFHTVLTVPNKVLQWGFSTGLYIQTSITYGKINYVACVGEASPLGIVWRVESGTGDNAEVTDHKTLWNVTRSSLTTRDCTIITNGNNYLKVYLDDNMVYSSQTLNLQMPRPFNSYLEVQTTSEENMYGKFKDYYSTAGENIKVINAPIGGIVKIVGTSPSKIFAKGIVDTHGVANLDIGQYHFPLNAQIQVYSSNKMISSSAPNTGLYGGDVYSTTQLNAFERWMLR